MATDIDALIYLEKHLVSVIQTIAIVAGLAFTAIQLRRNTAATKQSVDMEIMKSHREIWTHLLTNERLSRILDPYADLNAQPVSPSEKFFVVMLITHMKSAFFASRAGLRKTDEGAKRDIKELLSLPVPQNVWQQIKSYHHKDFVKFIDSLWVTGKK